jgi:hypothetical protein
MKNHYIFYLIITTTLIVKSSYADNNNNDSLFNKTSVSLPFAFNDVWSALLMALNQDSVQIKYINSQSGCIKTEIKSLPADTKNSIVAYRLTPMSKFNERYASWAPRINYSLVVTVSIQDATISKLEINTEIFMTEYTDKRDIFFKSNGSLEQKLVEHVKKNIDIIKKDKEVIVPDAYDFYHEILSSGKVECIVNKSKDQIWPLLLKLIRDNSIPMSFEDKSFGIIVTQSTRIDDDQKNSFSVKELAVPGKGLRLAQLATWKDNGGVSFKIFVTPVPDDFSKTKICIFSFFRKFDYDPSAEWYLFKSSGIFENQFLSSLKTALETNNPIDLIPFFNIHLDSAVSFLFDGSILKVWNSTIKSVADFGFRINQFDFDSCLYGVTHYKQINDFYLALEFAIEKISEDRCKITFASSSMVNNPELKRIGIDYKKNSNINIYEFAENIKSSLSRKFTGRNNVTEFLNTSFIKLQMPDSAVQSFIDDFEVFKAVDLIHGYNLFPQGICVTGDTGSMNLIFSGYVVQPFEVETTDLILPSLKSWILKKLVYNLGNSLILHINEIRAFDKVIFETKVKVLNLDDSTPIDLGYHTFLVEIKTEDLVRFLSLQLNIDSILNCSLVKYEDFNSN